MLVTLRFAGPRLCYKYNTLSLATGTCLSIWLQQSVRGARQAGDQRRADSAFRIDILAPTAAADSMEDADLRGTVFETGPDAPARRGPTPVHFDLSPWAGQTVRLRIATANNQALMRAGIDNVRLVPIDR